MKWRIAIFAILALGGTLVAASGDRFAQFAFLSSTGNNPQIVTPKFSPMQQQSAGLVVLEAPDNFADSIVRYGFDVSEKTHLKELDTVAYRIKPPAGMSDYVAEKKLKYLYPGIIVQNTEIDMVPTSSDRDSPK